VSEPGSDIKDLTIRWTQAQPAVAAYIASMVPDFHVLQQVAVAIVTKFGDYDAQRPFVAWAIGMARLEVLNHRRKQAGGPQLMDEQTLDRVTQTYQEMAPELSDLRRWLDECITSAQGKFRTVLELRYIRQMSPAAIARTLGATVNTVSVRLHRARLAVGDCVERKQRQAEERR
jgi:RNA polymerase sigma-70 factor (ECF subfamily)